MGQSTQDSLPDWELNGREKFPLVNFLKMSLTKFLKIILKNIKIIDAGKQGVNQNPAISPGAPGQEAWERPGKGGRPLLARDH